jgi:hypothetical protein
MSDIIIPGQRKNVQIGEKQRACVLVHAETKRILCFCLDDPFARKMAGSGYILHEIHHAHEYDAWAQKLRQQSSQENAIKDAAYLEREDAVRKRLRKQLRDRIPVLADGAQKMAVESALRCLDIMEERKKRYRAESFQVQEAYESSTANVGDDLVNKIMVPKK